MIHHLSGGHFGGPPPLVGQLGPGSTQLFKAPLHRERDELEKRGIEKELRDDFSARVSNPLFFHELQRQ